MIKSEGFCHYFYNKVKVAGVCPEKSNEAGEGSREQVLQGAAEETGAV